MAKFIHVQSPAGDNYQANADAVLYIIQDPRHPDECMLHFGMNQALTIRMSAKHFADRAHSVKSKPTAAPATPNK